MNIDADVLDEIFKKTKLINGREDEFYTPVDKLINIYFCFHLFLLKSYSIHILHLPRDY